MQKPEKGVRPPPPCRGCGPPRGCSELNPGPSECTWCTYVCTCRQNAHRHKNLKEIKKKRGYVVSRIEASIKILLSNIIFDHNLPSILSRPSPHISLRSIPLPSPSKKGNNPNNNNIPQKQKKNNNSKRAALAETSTKQGSSYPFLCNSCSPPEDPTPPASVGTGHAHGAQTCRRNTHIHKTKIIETEMYPLSIDVPATVMTLVHVIIEPYREHFNCLIVSLMSPLYPVLYERSLSRIFSSGI